MQAEHESEDNVKFLSTLEQHLQLIAGPPADDVKAFRSVQEALKPLMEALRLIWMLSSYCSDDASMANLLQQIGDQIGLPLLLTKSSLVVLQFPLSLPTPLRSVKPLQPSMSHLYVASFPRCSGAGGKQSGPEKGIRHASC